MGGFPLTRCGRHGPGPGARAAPARRAAVRSSCTRLASKMWSGVHSRKSCRARIGAVDRAEDEEDEKTNGRHSNDM